jgi:hypothetical protein
MMTTIVKNNKGFYMQQPQQRHCDKTRHHIVSKYPYRVHGGRQIQRMQGKVEQGTEVGGLVFLEEVTFAYFGCHYDDRT